MVDFGLKLSLIINKLLLKTYSASQPNSLYDEFEKVLLDNNISDRRFFLILNLVDYFEDAINHKFTNLDDNYSVVQARKDLILLANLITEGYRLIIPELLYKRLQYLAR